MTKNLSICLCESKDLRLGDPPPLSLYRDGNTTTFYDLATGWEESFVLSTRHYLDVLTNGGVPVLTAAEARQILGFALAAEDSARTGMPVAVTGLGEDFESN